MTSRVLLGSKVAAGPLRPRHGFLWWKEEVAVRPVGARHVRKNAPQEGLAPGAADEDAVVWGSCGALRLGAGGRAWWPDRFRLVRSITSGSR